MSGSVRKAAEVLNALADAQRDSSARELSELIGLPRSTTQRLLQTLEECGLVRQDTASRKYGLGPRTLTLGMAYLQGIDLRTQAHPHMLRLRDELGETIALAVRVGAARMYIEQIEAKAELKAKAEIGTLYPLWAGSAGRILLGSLPKDELERLVAEAGDVAFTHVEPHTMSGLLAKLDEERRLGYSKAFEETISGVHTISVPVPISDAEVVVLSASGPSNRYSDALMDESIAPLRRAAAEISESMGYVARPARDSFLPDH